MNRLSLIMAGLGIMALPAACSESDVAKHRNALWHVVKTFCMRNMQLTGLAAPCAAVDPVDGVAIVKDAGRAGYLVVPTRRITGIEDPKLLDAGAPNYWMLAWQARSHVEAALHRRLARDEVGMAVNARVGRTQDQLHIHVGCVRGEVKRALAAPAILLRSEWTTIQLRGHIYNLRALPETDLARDPFRLVASTGPGNAALSNLTMAVIGAWLHDGLPGFVLLTEQANEANQGHAEELLDHACSMG